MRTNPFSTFRTYLVSTIILFIVGWGGAAVAIFTLTPTVWARWIFFFCGTLGIVSLALPVTWFINLRFRSDPPAGPIVILRQAIWIGLYAALLFWLQQERLVTIWVGIGLAAGLGAIEYLIRMREQTRWAPNQNPPALTGEQPPKDSDQTEK